jgi:hypothetical protein
MERWNSTNPESVSHISVPAVLRRVKAMREDKATRMERTAPKGMRADVRRQQAEGST